MPAFSTGWRIGPQARQTIDRYNRAAAQAGSRSLWLRRRGNGYGTGKDKAGADRRCHPEHRYRHRGRPANPGIFSLPAGKEIFCTKIGSLWRKWCFWTLTERFDLLYNIMNRFIYLLKMDRGYPALTAAPRWASKRNPAEKRLLSENSLPAFSEKTCGGLPRCADSGHRERCGLCGGRKPGMNPRGAAKPIAFVTARSLLQPDEKRQ